MRCGRTKSARRAKELAVSETIGFIIIFGIVMTGIGIVTLYGYPALIQEQQNTNIKNMQKNFLVLQSDLKSLTFKNIPYQETTMQVSGGTFSILDEPTLTPKFLIEYDTTQIPHYPGELKFVSNDGMTNMALENGAVHFRQWSNPTGSAMISDPSWFYDPITKTYVIHLIRMNATSDFAQNGIGTVRMILINPTEQSPPINITGKTVKISYSANPEESYTTAWKNYFGTPDLRMTSPTVTGFTVSTTLDPSAEWLVVKKYNVSILSL